MKNKLICVTNRHLCEDDFLDRLRGIACAGNELNNSDNKRQTEFWGIMLREKDLSFPEYEKLAREVKKICDNAGVVFIAHFFTGIGFTDHLHLPLHKLKKYRKHQGCTDREEVRRIQEGVRGLHG